MSLLLLVVAAGREKSLNLTVAISGLRNRNSRNDHSPGKLCNLLWMALECVDNAHGTTISHVPAC